MCLNSMPEVAPGLMESNIRKVVSDFQGQGLMQSYLMYEHAKMYAEDSHA